VETEDNVLVIRRIHVAMRLVAAAELKDKIERVHGVYAMELPALPHAAQGYSAYVVV
jgi:hypothetical protein